MFGQQPGGIVRCTQEQAIQLRGKGIENLSGQLPTVLFAQRKLMYCAFAPLQCPAIFRKSGNDDHRMTRLKTINQRKDRLRLPVTSEDPRRKNMMVLRQRGMQMGVIHIRIALSAVQIVD
ncbi:hypothetical protein D3C81_1728210 [compost metagenome]